MKRLLSAIAFMAAVQLTAAQGFDNLPDPVEDVNKVVDNTPDSIAKALMSRPEPGTTRKGDNPVLFLIGNSTMRNGTKGDGSNGQWGWGFFASKYFNANKISVENQALGGMSTRTFYNKLWPMVRKALRKGDWVIISIGHNDNGPYDEGRARAVIPGVGTDSLCVTIKETGQKETVYTYGGYLRKYIAECREAGAHPILMSLTPRDAYDEKTGKIVRKPQTEWAAYVAAQEGVPFVDLNEISGSKLDSYSHWKEKYHFFGDHIHSSAYGAELNARSAAEGMWGWGSQAYTVFDENKVTCVNVAKAGRSTRSYVREGRWEQVYNSLQPGDFVLLQFGHNDICPITDAKERGVIPGTADTCHVYKMEKDGRYEVVYSFGWYLRKMIDDCREKGATPILVSLTPRNEWPKGKVERRNGSYGKWYREVVEQTGVDFLDVHNISADFLDKKFASKSEEKSKKAASKYFNHDHTHTSLAGARMNAQSVAKGLRDMNSPLAAYLKKGK